jgi:hypothetical protein
MMVFAIGAGMIVDESIFLIATAGKHIDYFSMRSLLGAIIMSLVLISAFYLIAQKGALKPTETETHTRGVTLSCF